MFRLCGILLTSVILFGCAATTESRLDSVRGNFMSTQTYDTDFSSQNNLDLLITADALFHNDEYAKSDAAYEEFNRRNIDTIGGSFSREAAALALGPNANDYKPYMMDSLFVSYYQLWSALATGRYNDARVIINQSYGRQQEMSRAYKETIESNRDKLANYDQLATRLNDDNAKWTPYRDIMNPALMYLSGIYFLTQQEYNDAETYLSRAAGMVPENSFIATDLDFAKKHQSPKNTTWVFIEDGFAPKLHETRLSLPVVLDSGISVITIAMSEPLFFDNFTNISGAQELADVDSMFVTEYQEYRTNDALRALTTTIAKTALQTTAYGSRSSSAPLMGLLATVYSELTTGAEVRTWATLPKTISVMRVENNKSGLIELRSNGNLEASISLPDVKSNYLVYVRVGPDTYDTKIIKLK